MNFPNRQLSILVVEDELIIAMDVEMIIEDAGHRVVASCTSLKDVRALPMGDVPDLALVDMQLAGGATGLEVGHEIRSRWPQAAIVFVTANAKKVPEEYDGLLGTIGKPFSASGFTAALGFIHDLLSGRTEGQIPSEFTPARRSADRLSRG